MNDFFQRLAEWQKDWDAAPATLLLQCLRAEAALRPSLGVGECKAIIEALERGIGMADRTALEQLLTQMLVKKTADEAVVLSAVAAFFHARAEQVYRQATEVLRDTAPETTTDSTQKPTPEQEGEDDATRKKREEADRLKKLKEEEDRKKAEAELKTPKQTETTVQLELSLTTAELAAATGTEEETEQDFHTPAISIPYIFTNDYQPLSVRQLEQLWRFLRKPSRANTVNPVPDIPRTVERMARQGWLDTPVWQQDKTNKVHLVLLIDHTGSMAAWHSLAQQLVETARKGGGHREAEVRWMYNLPNKFESAAKPGLFFKDQNHLKTEPVADLLRRCSKQDTEVLIFSDAGAARGRLSLERSTATSAFVNLLKRHVSSVAWLNPMPPNRWWGSTAELCAHKVHMFETSQRGFMAMINHLRGQS